MGDWEFISDEERQESSRKARPPLTFARIGQITGGTIACWFTAAVCFLAFWLRWTFDPRQIAVSGALCLGALYVGAWAGQRVGAVFDRKRR